MRQVFIGFISLLAITAIQTSAFADPLKTAQSMGIMQGSPPSILIDIEKWDKGPDNRWAFQHVSEIIPTANISRGSGCPTPLVKDLKDLSGISFIGNKDKEVTIKQMLEDTYTDGFIVLKNGKIIFEQYFNGMTPHTRHLLMSVSKSLTGTLAGQLVMDGRLKPKSKVIEYIPELKDSTGFAEATVQEVLDMSTSIVFVEDYDDPKAEVITHEQASAWRGRTEIANKGLYAYAKTIKKDKRKHGELFHYASINTDVLGWLIERSSGQRYVDFMSDSIWSKLGADHDAQISVDYFGSAVANGGYCITLRDLARFGQMMLDDGYYNSQQIIDKKWIHDIRFNGKNSAWKQTKYGEIWPNGFYRDQWYSTKDEQGSFFAIGVNGQHIWINPTSNVVIVKFSSHPVSADVDSGITALRGMDAIAKSFDIRP